MFKNIFKRLPPYGAKDLEGGALNGPKKSTGFTGYKWPKNTWVSNWGSFTPKQGELGKSCLVPNGMIQSTFQKQ